MPTYEYACDACGHEFEREQRMTDKPLKKCPKCGKMKSRRMLSSSNFILKGGGWYADGYSGKGAKSGSKNSDSAKPASSKSEKAPASDACASCPAKKD
ncbi:MAG: zinc ribbon domain-containing protein [Deltaproteobacteria bacterium]|nr:zinc ribbon domain-containing protein [Deltaproteobacteria bacterium]